MAGPPSSARKARMREGSLLASVRGTVSPARCASRSCTSLRSARVRPSSGLTQNAPGATRRHSPPTKSSHSRCAIGRSPGCIHSGSDGATERRYQTTSNASPASSSSGPLALQCASRPSSSTDADCSVGKSPPLQITTSCPRSRRTSATSRACTSSGKVAMRRRTESPRSGRGSASLELYPHLAQHGSDGGEERGHVGDEEAPDVADAEAIGLGDLAGVDQEAARREAAVEVGEVEPRVPRVEERADDRARVLARDEGAEAEGLHPAAECLVIGAVARAAGRDATLELELDQRLAQREQRVRRRREAELAVLLEAAPLRVEVERERPRPALEPLQRAPPRDHEGEARDALEALVRRGREVVHARGLELDRERPEGAHRVDEERAAGGAHGLADRAQRIEHARGGLDVDQDRKS